MRTLIFSTLITICSVVKAQCEDLTLKQEVTMTENIALVQSLGVEGDSVKVEVVKKWKGDSIGTFVYFKQEDVLSKDFRVDSNKTYMLFWFNGLAIDRCSRSSEFVYTHFEYQLDELLKEYKVENVLIYDSIQYRKRHVFNSGGQEFDNKKGKYAFYDVESGKLKEFSDLPKETSYFYPRRFYIVDKAVETATKKYDIVFAVSKAHQELIITNDLKKKALQSLFKQ